MKKYLLCFLSAAVVLVSITSCAVNPVTGQRDLMLVSNEQEINMGKSYDPQVVAQYGVYQDKTLQAFIETNGQKMAKISHRPELDWHFKIMDSPVVNAFAVPGGYVYFTRGILAHFNNEAEFAGVLGHEIGHVTARHSAKQMTRSKIANAGMMIGAIAAPKLAGYMGQAQQLTQLMFLKFGRDAESQSDQLGVEYSTKIDYDARYMAGFFKTLGRLSAKSGQSIPDFMSSHPNPADRFTAVGKLSKEWQAKDPGATYKVGRNSYLKMIDGLVYGENPRNGFVSGGKFHHPDLKFSFNVPQGWKLQNGPTQVQMAQADGKAAVIFTLSKETTLEAAVKAYAAGFKMNIKETRDTRINGNAAKSTYAEIIQKAKDGTTSSLSVLSYAIKYNNVVYLFHGLTSSELYAGAKAKFATVGQSFTRLTDTKLINIKPERISIKAVPRTMTLQAFFASQRMPKERYEEFAILNQLQLTDRVPAKTLIKTVRRG